ncbi:hypothetical protein BpHYR1_002769 [Brachionus plicatilis]|uniref:Uncharacterized protein n=1 Tax=Brachionus plicatilis TaxID=10195 RepID=A0A3M7SZL7_BRAPC|nr:hypothetical protein BpHYR1_002769 [Brachionus plicatilis]
MRLISVQFLPIDIIDKLNLLLGPPKLVMSGESMHKLNCNTKNSMQKKIKLFQINLIEPKSRSRVLDLVTEIQDPVIDDFFTTDHSADRSDKRSSS